MRNTPTGVGKTWAISSSKMTEKKHPHGRGEDTRITPSSIPLWETPPRAWGRLAKWRRIMHGPRNTPTGVGKTFPPRHDPRSRQKHPHGRGEDRRSSAARWACAETPPRAWGRPPGEGGLPLSHRNTPTGVGKTHQACQSLGCARKHPHGRGEDGSGLMPFGQGVETPPRAWGRRRRGRRRRRRHIRNTPTGVGKTAP